MKENGRPCRRESELETNFAKHLLTVLLPEPPAVRVSVQSKMQPNNWVLVLTMPLLGPSILGQPNPGFSTLESGLGVCLLAVCLLARVARCIAVGVQDLASFHGGRA